MHSLTRRSFLAGLASLPLAGSALGQQRGNLLPSVRELNRLGLERMWWSRAVIDPRRDVVTHVSSDDHNVYVQSSAGMTTAFDAESGRKLWAAQLGRADATSFPVTSNDEFAIVCGGPMMFAVDKFSGESIWRIRLPAMPSAQPSMDDEYIYVPSLTGSIYALELRKIKELFQQQRLPEWSGEAVAWRYQSGEEITTSPVSTQSESADGDGLVVNFASKDKSLYSVERDTRKLRWQFETDSAIIAPLAYDGRFLYLATQDFNFYCLDAEKGSVQWEFVSGLPVANSPRVVGDQVFLVPTRGGIYALDTVSGRSLWWEPKLIEYVAASPTTLYATDRVGNLVLVDRADGSIRGALPLRSFGKRYENDHTDRIYVATNSGVVLALREKGQEFPIFHKYPERRPLLPELAPEEPPAPADAGEADFQLP